MSDIKHSADHCVAVVVANDFEESELTVPVDSLVAAGFHCEFVGTESGQHLTGKKGHRIVTDKNAQSVNSADYCALLIPGGYSPDQLRINKPVVNLVADFCAAGKPVAAICHGPQLLIEAAVAKGGRMTSWPSLRSDLVNAGAHWVDEAVVRDRNLITSRKPADLQPFCKTLIAQLETTG